MTEPIRDARIRDDFQRYLMDLGRLFVFDNVLVDIEPATPLHVLVITPDSAQHIYFWMHIGTSDAITMDIFEQPTTSFDGVGVVLVNLNRRSALLPTVQMNIGATITETGDPLRKQQFGASMNETPRIQTPMILARHEKYLLQFTAEASPNSVNLFLAFGEHEPNR